MNFTSKQIWLINYPVMMSVLVEQLINITDAIFLGHIGETELGASASRECTISPSTYWVSGSASAYK